MGEYRISAARHTRTARTTNRVCPNVPKVDRSLHRSLQILWITYAGVIITDGQSQGDALSAAQALCTVGVCMNAAGVTDLVDISQLFQITGTAARVFLVDEYSSSMSSIDLTSRSAYLHLFAALLATAFTLIARLLTISVVSVSSAVPISLVNAGAVAN